MLPEKIIKAAAKAGIKRFNEVQRIAFQEILTGNNTLIIAPTGSGKTEAAILPAMGAVLESRADPISILYITPLRALNRDLCARIDMLGKESGLRVEVRHGDTTQYKRMKQADDPPDVLITTPETLQSILPAKKMGKHLKNVKFVIIDEIHELFSEKRGYQLAVGLERLKERAGNFVRIGLSATIGDPKEAANFLSENTKILNFSMKKKYLLKVILPKPKKKGEIPPEVYSRIEELKEILEKHKQVITFVNTRNTAEQLSFYMSHTHESTDVHHSSLARDVRTTTEKKFKNGEIKHLIATSSMELGIDVGNVDAVVQYGSPRQVVRLLQRVGRAGHKWDKPSVGYIISVNERDFLESSVIAKFATRGIMETQKTEKNPLDVLAHQIAGIVMDFGEIKINKALEIVKRAYPFKDLEVNEFFEVLKQLEDERYIKIREDTIIKTKDTWRYYYSNLSMIPDEEKFFVVDVSSGRSTATLDEDFVVSYLEPGVVFVVKGRLWRVIGIENKNVYCEPSEYSQGAIPAWIGEQIPVERFVAEEVWREISKINEASHIRDLSDWNSLERVIERYRKVNTDLGEIVVESEGNFVVVLYPLGSKGNAALSRLLAGEITRKFGIPVRAFSTPYSSILEFPSEGGENVVINVLESISPESVDVLLEKHVLKSNLFRWRFMHVARRFGLIQKGAKLERSKIVKLIGILLDSPIYKETMKEIFLEKMDPDAVKDIIEKIHSGAIRIKKRPMSILGREEISSIMSVPEVLSQTPEKTLIEIFKERILKKEIEIVCTSCGSERKVTVSEPPDKCPACGSALLAVTRDAKEARKLLQKKKTNKEERKKILELIRSAELHSTFGKRAIIALSVPGVGPNKAAKILSTPYNEDEFWKALLNAEREYYRTKMFWK